MQWLRQKHGKQTRSRHAHTSRIGKRHGTRTSQAITIRTRLGIHVYTILRSTRKPRSERGDAVGFQHHGWGVASHRLGLGPIVYR